MNHINKALEIRRIPNELNYTSSKDVFTLDLEKLRYNTFYKTHEYFDKRFHPCLKSLPGYDKIIDSIVEQNKDNSLTKEMAERKNVSSDIIEEQ